MIKDAYKINIYDTLYEVQNGNIDTSQAKDVIVLGQQLITKNWNEYINNSQSNEFEPTFITKYIKKIFSFKNPAHENLILQENIIQNINKKIKHLNSHIHAIETYLKMNNLSTKNEHLNHVYSEINSINIYITNLINYDLNVAIDEKRDTEKVFNVLTMILNFSIIFVFLSSIILSVFLINNVKKLHIVLEDTVDEKTKELQQLNKNLEKKIKFEVANNRKKI